MHFFRILSYIFIILFSLLGIICALIFISILIIYRQYRSRTTLLGFNSVLAGFIVNVALVCQSIYQLITNGNDKVCVFRGFILQITCGLFFHSFCVQAIYHLFATIAHRRKYLQSDCTILCVILVQWFISCTFALPLLLHNRITFDAINRICQVSMDDLYGFLYVSTWIYLFPLIIIIGVYIRIVFYIKHNSASLAIQQSVLERQRKQRDFRIFRNIMLLIIALVIMNFPSIIFFLITQLTHVILPAYTERISCMAMSFSHGVTMLLCLINHDNVRKCLLKKIRKKKRRKIPRRVQCVSIIYNPLQIAPINNG